jgi:small redox-active disulfide protein 2
MKIIVYGTGCPNCEKLAQNVFSAISKLDIPADVEKCTDIRDIAQSGILRTPGLSIDGEIVSQGKVLAVSNIEDMIKARIR